jgi:rfaE bifunctional protein nucleotidyltransferase chain/domain
LVTDNEVIDKVKDKIIDVETFIILREDFKKQSRNVIFCHGVFDLLHPGHIIHLEEAKSLGDILVVSVTSELFVRKGPGRPYFNDDLRLKSLAALSCVDYVILSKNYTAVDVINKIKPDLYVKGSEYSISENDVTEMIDVEVNEVKKYGGNVHYTSGVTSSSTKLINNYFNVFSDNTKSYLVEFSKKHTFKELQEIINEIANKKVLVIGDVIIDEYVFCSVQGLMSKDYGFSTRYQGEERYLGGILAIANHISSFTNKVNVCSVIGDEPHIHSRILNDLGNKMFLDLNVDSNFKTVVKRRFLSRRGIRNEYDKLFSVNNLFEKNDDSHLNKNDFYKKLEKNIGEYDVVILVDYGHGLIDSKAMDIIQDKAKFLALNCQTNSSNFGSNLITKYKRADTFTMDEKEISLATSDNVTDVKLLLSHIHKYFGEKRGWLTLGSKGALGIDSNKDTVLCPAFTLNIQDTVGAGDAFFSLASLCDHSNIPHEISAFLGNIAGGIAVNILGNSRGVDKTEFLKFVSTLINF